MPSSRRRFLLGLGALAIGAAAIAAESQLNKLEPETTSTTSSSTGNASQATTVLAGKVGFRVETFVENLTIPWSLAWAPDGRGFFTERPGRISVITIENNKPTLFAEVKVEHIGEGGLLGLALSPQFDANRFVYVYHTYRDGSVLRNRVIRYQDQNGTGTNPTVILDKIPAGSIHDGGRIRFGPDGKLYVTCGETGNGQLAQDLQSLAGKILRLNPDGTVPNGNPFSNSLVYSYGNRNAQGIDWHPLNGKLYESEHGPSGENGRFANDEINLIEPGKNYGWPIIVGYSNDPRYTNPVYNTGDDETWAPSGCTFYTGNVFPDWKYSFFVACLRGVHIHRFVFDPQTGAIQINEKLLTGKLGRLRDVVQGPDGLLYILTSNRDGRGSPVSNDDRILQLVPTL